MLHETYRPRDWHQVAGQEKAVNALRALESRGALKGRAYWLSGRSGNGKTTLARIIASKVSRPDMTVEMDAGELTAGAMRDIQNTLDGVRSMAECPLFGDSFAPNSGLVHTFIINEAHGMKRDAIRHMLKLLESPYIEHAVFIFTTTLAGQMQFEDNGVDAGPLLSRCTAIKLAERGVAEAAAERLREIAQAENLDGRPVADYVRLFHDSGSNFREALNRIESGCMAKS